MSILEDVQGPVQEHLKAYQKLFKESLKTKIRKLDWIIHYLVRQKGKQLRPLLVFLSAGLCGKINQRTYRGAILVETLHTATLIHDDVVDSASERRGILSINYVWKNKIAVLAGDYLLSRGLLYALEYEDYHFLQLLSKAVKNMSEGELYQMEKSSILSLSQEEYFEILHQKTGSLLIACVQIGASSTEKSISTSSQQALYDFAYALGIAFQIRDDILDYVGKQTGKSIGLDLKNQKITLPLIYALEHGTEKEKKNIQSLLRKNKNISTKSQKIIRDFVHEKEGIRRAKEHLRSRCQTAQKKLEVFPESEYKTSLKNLTKWIQEE
ncbi:MAG: polyprenyl synthetase family protein [Cytophagales bacterium]|nr:polyprenyl synthetase family protein [Cytophagales bacterium]